MDVDIGGTAREISCTGSTVGEHQVSWRVSVRNHEDRHGQPLVGGEAILEERHEVRSVELPAVAEPAGFFHAVEGRATVESGNIKGSVDRSALGAGKQQSPHLQ